MKETSDNPNQSHIIEEDGDIIPVHMDEEQREGSSINKNINLRQNQYNADINKTTTTFAQSQLHNRNDSSLHSRQNSPHDSTFERSRS